MIQTTPYIPPKNKTIIPNPTLGIVANTYQKGWELTYALMEKYFGEQEVKIK